MGTAAGTVLLARHVTVAPVKQNSCYRHTQHLRITEGDIWFYNNYYAQISIRSNNRRIVFTYTGCTKRHFTHLKINHAKTMTDRNVRIIANERHSF